MGNPFLGDKMKTEVLHPRSVALWPKKDAQELLRKLRKTHRVNKVGMFYEVAEKGTGRVSMKTLPGPKEYLVVVSTKLLDQLEIYYDQE